MFLLVGKGSLWFVRSPLPIAALRTQEWAAKIVGMDRTGFLLA
jgi:hypothetical protein